MVFKNQFTLNNNTGIQTDFTFMSYMVIRTELTPNIKHDIIVG